MKFKILKMTIRVYDLAVFLFLVGYFFHKPFRDLFDGSPYLVKALAWLLVALFFYYSIASWFYVVKKSMVNVLKREEELSKEVSSEEEASSEEEVEGTCQFVTGQSAKETYDEHYGEKGESEVEDVNI